MDLEGLHYIADEHDIKRNANNDSPTGKSQRSASPLIVNKTKPQLTIVKMTKHDAKKEKFDAYQKIMTKI